MKLTMDKKTAESAWNNCLSVIKDNVNPQNFKTWFEPIKAIKLQEKVLTIQVPSQFFYDWLEEHYITLLKKVTRKELGIDGRIEYNIVMENSHKGERPITIKVPSLNRDVKNSPVSMPIDISN